MKKIFILSAFIYLITALHAADIYVTPNGAGLKDGSSWANAKAGATVTSGQVALGSIISTATNSNIYVAAGTYYLGSQSDFFPIKSGVKVYGGYNASTGARDWANNITTLSADVNKNDGSNSSTKSDNAPHVISSDNATLTSLSGALYDGFYVSGGYGGSRGGGIYINNVNNFGSAYNFSDMIIEDCQVISYGGGISFNQASKSIGSDAVTLKMYNVTIRNCKAGTWGGGLDLTNSRAKCDYLTVVNNSVTAGNGGGVYITTGRLNTTYCNISYNTASANGGGMYNTSSELDARHAVINHNTAGGIGGGTYNTSTGGLYYFTDGQINYNKATGDGGGMYNTTSHIELRSMEIVGNSSSAYGGGMNNTTTQKQHFWNVLIANNYCTYFGGGIFNTTTYDDCYYINCTIVNNFALGAHGGGIYNTSASQKIYNSIVYGNKQNNGVANDISDYTYASTFNRINHSQIGIVDFSFANYADAESQTLYGQSPQFSNSQAAPTTSTISVFQNPMTSYYRLTTTSPGVNRGDNSYINSVTYPWMEFDLAERLRIQDGIVDLGVYEGPGGYVCPPTAVWQPMSNNPTDWNDFRNWSSREVPGSCTHVYIPSYGISGYNALENHYETSEITKFPLLVGNPTPGTSTTPPTNTCDAITFLAGTEIGRQDLLAYNKAYVQMDFGYNGISRERTSKLDLTTTSAFLKWCSDHSKASLTRNRWYFFSSPLQEVVSGDYGFGGYPRTFMNRFIASSTQPGAYTVGTWTGTFANQNVVMTPGEGFAYWMNAYSTSVAFSLEEGNQTDNNFTTQRTFGIKSAKGIMQFPYFETPDLVTQRRIVKHDAALGTLGTTSFYNYSNVYNTVMDGPTNFARGSSGRSPYRLNTSPTNFTVDDFNSKKEILVGNPFMTTIDFIQFYNANSSHIEPQFRIFDGNSYIQLSYDAATQTITTIPATGVSRYIAPMQGFLVKMKDMAGNDASLSFDIAALSSTSKMSNTYLRNVNQNANNAMSEIHTSDNDIIRIKATNAYASSEALIRLSSNASDGYSADEDMSKLFVTYGGSPDVFTVADSIPLTMNFVNSSNLVIPIGMKTQATGNTSFELTGMDRYNAERIEFIDVALNVRIDITNDAAFDYAFNNTVNGVLTERFYLNFAPGTTTDFDNAKTNDINVNVYFSNRNIFIASTEENPIRTVNVFNTQGKLLQTFTSVGSSYFQLGDGLPVDQFLIISIETQQGISRKKVILN